MKIRKCKYCGAPIPEKDQDTIGRKHTKTTDFCRGTNHYRLYWNKIHKEYKKIQDRIRYLERKIMEGDACDEELKKVQKVFEKLKKRKAE